MRTRFQHKVVVITLAGERELARKSFRNSFTRSAYAWYQDIVAQSCIGHARYERDMTVARQHWTDSAGNVFELR